MLLPSKVKKSTQSHVIIQFSFYRVHLWRFFHIFAIFYTIPKEDSEAGAPLTRPPSPLKKSRRHHTTCELKMQSAPENLHEKFWKIMTNLEHLDIYILWRFWRTLNLILEFLERGEWKYFLEFFIALKSESVWNIWKQDGNNFFCTFSDQKLTFFNIKIRTECAFKVRQTNFLNLVYLDIWTHRPGSLELPL